MAKDKKADIKEITTVASEAELAALAERFPQDDGYNRVFLPRLNLVSQDVMEGKGKSMKVVTEAGTFVKEIQSEEEEEGDNGKMYKPWIKTELGNEIEVIILFQRKQLRHYDSKNEVYTSSPIYDSSDEIIPLFKQKSEVARGLPKDLKARPEFQGLTAAGKPTSKLEDNKVLYVLYEGEVYQLSFRGTSMYAFMDYAKKTKIPTVVTTINSEAMEKGTTRWNQATFEAKRKLTSAEAKLVGSKLDEIEAGIAQEKAFFAAQAPAKSGDEKVDEEVSKF